MCDVEVARREDHTREVGLSSLLGEDVRRAEAFAPRSTAGESRSSAAMIFCCRVGSSTFGGDGIDRDRAMSLARVSCPALSDLIASAACLQLIEPETRSQGELSAGAVAFDVIALHADVHELAALAPRRGENDGGLERSRYVDFGGVVV